MLRSLLLLPALLVGLPAAAAPLAQESAPSSDLAEIARAVAESNGGAERLEAMTQLRFRVTPQEQRGESEEAEWVGLTSYVVELADHPERGRRVRIEEQTGERTLVKLVDLTSGRAQVFADGTELTLGEVRQAALADAAGVRFFADLLFGLPQGRLVGRYEGERTRDGEPYDAIVAEAPRLVVRLFVAREPARLERYESFDRESLRRTGTTVLSEWARIDEVWFPGLAEFGDRDGVPRARWVLSDFDPSPELEPVRFERP